MLRTVALETFFVYTDHDHIFFIRFMYHRGRIRLLLFIFLLKIIGPLPRFEVPGYGKHSYLSFENSLKFFSVLQSSSE